MNKPINVSKITGKKILHSNNHNAFVMLLVEGLNDALDETNLFINVVEVYSEPIPGTWHKATPSKWLGGIPLDGPFLKTDIETLQTDDADYEFSITGDKSVSGVVDWLQTHVLIFHINWHKQLITATFAAVGDGINGDSLAEQYVFKTEDAKDLHTFGNNVIQPYLNYFTHLLQKMIDASQSRPVRLSHLRVGPPLPTTLASSKI